MTHDQYETVQLLREMAPDQCESKDTKFHVSKSDQGYRAFEMYSELVYLSGEIAPDGRVSWN